MKTAGTRNGGWAAACPWIRAGWAGDWRYVLTPVGAWPSRVRRRFGSGRRRRALARSTTRPYRTPHRGAGLWAGRAVDLRQPDSLQRNGVGRREPHAAIGLALHAGAVPEFQPGRRAAGGRSHPTGACPDAEDQSAMVREPSALPGWPNR